MGLLDLLAWSEASKASKDARGALQKMDALEKKIDMIAKKLDEFESYLRSQV